MRLAAEHSCRHMSSRNLVICGYVDDGKGLHWCIHLLNRQKSVFNCAACPRKKYLKAEKQIIKALFFPGSAALVKNVDVGSDAGDAERITMAGSSPSEKECCRRDPT